MLQVLSSTTATCTTGPTAVIPPVHRITVLGPHLRYTQQALEIWETVHTGRKVFLSGSFTISLEDSCTTQPLVLPLLESDTTTIANALYSGCSRAGTVDVLYTLRTEIDAVTGLSWTVKVFVVTFLNREDAVPLMSLNTDQLVGWSAGDKVITVMKLKGGCDSAVPTVQQWSIAQSNLTATHANVQRVVISVAKPIFEIQRVDLSLAYNNPNPTTTTISGFFTLSYGSEHTTLLAAASPPSAIANALKMLPDIGDVKVTRVASTVTGLGYNWLVTFLTPIPGTRPLLVANKKNAFAKFSNLTVSLVTRGSKLFGGHFELGWKDVRTKITHLTRPLAVTATAQDVQEALAASFNWTSTYPTPAVVTVSPSSTVFNTSRSWDITFPPEMGNVGNQLLTVYTTNVTGTNVLTHVVPIDKGTTRLDGTYNLSLTYGGAYYHTAPIDLNASAAMVQSALQLALKNVLVNNRLILVTDNSTSSYQRQWLVTFPISMGVVSTMLLNTARTIGTAITHSISTLSVGPYYVPLGGTFTLTVEGVTTIGLPYNAAASALTSALQSLATVANATVTTTRSSNGLIEYYGRQYSGTVWNVTFNELVLPVNFNGVVDVKMDASGLAGYSPNALGINFDSASCMVAVHEEIDAGNGPFVAVEMSFNGGQHYTTDRNMYELVEPLVLLGIHPSAGPYSGGTLITVFTEVVRRSWGMLSDYDVQCGFGQALVPGRFVSNSSIQCVSPRYPLITGGVVSLSITLNDQEFATDLSAANEAAYSAYSTTTFVYQPAISNLAINPGCGSVYGNTVVNITSTSIVASSQAYCSFDDAIVVADTCIDGLIQCRTPPFAYAATFTPPMVAVSFSLNGQDYMNDTGLFFVYSLPPVVKDIFPKTGAVSEGTVVTIIGENMGSACAASATPLCRFGDQVVTAKFNLDKSVSCVAPPKQGKPEIQAVDLATVPFLPTVQEITIESEPLYGDTYTITSQAEPWLPQITEVAIGVRDVNEAQELTLGINTNPPPSALLRQRDWAVLPEIQVIQSAYQFLQEIQILYIRSPVNSPLNTMYPEVHEIFTSSSFSSTKIFVTWEGVPTFWFPANIDSESLQLLWQSKYPSFAANCVVTEFQSGSNTTFTITYDVSMGDVDDLTVANVIASRGIGYGRTVSQGGDNAIQRIKFFAQDDTTPFRLALGDSTITTGLLYQTSLPNDIQLAMANVRDMGQVDVSTTTDIFGTRIWTISFLQAMGPLPLLSVVGGYSSVSVSTLQTGTTSIISGNFTLSMLGVATPSLSTRITGLQLADALNAYTALENVTCVRYDTINGGAMFMIYFLNQGINYPLIEIDARSVSGTAVVSETQMYQEGDVISGTFIVLTNMGLPGNQLYSDPIPYNASADQIAQAFTKMNSSYGPLIVTRTQNTHNVQQSFISYEVTDDSHHTPPFHRPQVNSPSLTLLIHIPFNALRYCTYPPFSQKLSPDAASVIDDDTSSSYVPTYIPVTVTRSLDNSIIQAYSWTLTFPVSAGNVPYHDVNNDGTTGYQVDVEILTIQNGQTPTVMQISTTSSSPLIGYFTLSLEGHTTSPIAHDASALDVQAAIASLPTAGVVTVTRTPTGVKDFNTWGGFHKNYTGPSIYSPGVVHLAAAYPMFLYNLSTYDWMVTFVSRTGVIPLITGCCDQLSGLDPALVTLTAAISLDAQIVVSRYAQGTATSIYGNVSLKIDDKITPYFNLSASTAKDVQNAIGALGYNTDVTRLPADENGQYSWRVVFDRKTVPVMDMLVSPRLQVLTNRAFPDYGRQHLSFNWEYSVPQHNVQMINVSRTATGTITCVVTNIYGDKAPVAFDATASASNIQKAFNNRHSVFGTVTVFVVTNYTEQLLVNTSQIRRFVVFNDYLHVLPVMSCTGNTPTVPQLNLTHDPPLCNISFNGNLSMTYRNRSSF